MTASSSVVPFPAVKSRKAHARFRDGWFSRLASDPTLSAGDLATGLMLALHMNAKTRQAWPSIDRIAQLTGRKRTRLALHWAPEEGGPDHGDRVVVGGIRPNRYCFVEDDFKDCAGAYFEALQ